MRVAILGGSRFIGYHLAQALVACDHQVTLFNRGRTEAPAPFHPSINRIFCDRNAPVHVNRLLTTFFDVVFDLSGHSPGQVNAFVTPEHRTMIGHYIFCSTSSVYEMPPPVPCDESSPRSSASDTYGGKKAVIENLLMAHWQRDHWPVTVVRPQGVFGPYDAQQLAYVIARLRVGRPVFVQEPSQGRINFLYVHDLVNALVRTIGNEVSYGKIYNVAGDEIVTPQEFVALCGELSGDRAYFRALTGWRNRLTDVGMPWLPYDLVASNRAIKLDLGISFTPFKKALAETCAWLDSDPRQLVLETTPTEAALQNNLQIPLGYVATSVGRLFVRTFWRAVTRLFNELIKLPIRNVLMHNKFLGRRKLLR